MTRQLIARSEPALIAALGLDRRYRNVAGRLLAGRLHDSAIPQEHMPDLAIVALLLAESPGPDTREWTQIIGQAAARHLLRPGWNDLLANATHRMEPPVASEVLTVMLGDQAEQSLWSALVAVADAMEPSEAARVLANALERVKTPEAPNSAPGMRGGGTGMLNPRTSLASGLASAAGRMEPVRGAKVLTEALKREGDSQARQQLALGLAPLAIRMEPGQAVRLCAFALEQVKDFNLVQRSMRFATMSSGQPQDLATLVKRLPAAEAGQLCGEVGRSLAAALEAETDTAGRCSLALGLTTVATRLPPAEAGKLCGEAGRSLAAALEKETRAAERRSLALDLTTVAGRMNPAEAADVCGQAARTLATALEKETDVAARRSLSLGLTTVASRMDPAEAAQVCGQTARLMTAAFEKETDADVRSSLAYGLSSLSVRLDQDEAIKTVRLIVSAMQDHWAYNQSGSGFYELLTQEMDPGDANRVALILVAAIGQETDSNARWWLAAGLAMVAPRMEPKQAARICAPVFLDLIGAFVRKRHSSSLNGNYNHYMADGVRAASAGVDQIHAVKAAQAIVHDLNRGVEDEMRGVLTTGLATVSERLSTGEADKILTEAMQREADAGVRQNLATALAGRMEPARAAGVLLPLIEREKDPPARQNLIQGLCSVASRMTPDESSRLLDQAGQVLIGSFRSAPSPAALGSLLTPIESLAGGMKADAAAKVCAQAARVISDARENDPDGLLPKPGMMDPLRALVSLAGRMKTDEANRLCIAVIRTLLKKSESTSETIIVALAQLDPARAKDLAREVALLLSSGNVVDASTLDLVLTDDNRSAPIPRNQGMMGGMMRGPNPPEKPLPCRLATQDLVELLKMPTCFGAARRVVLDHLGNRYGRRFANHWAFVRYAQEQGLKLDLTSPPRRPNAEESVQRMLEILDGPK